MTCFTVPVYTIALTIGMFQQLISNSESVTAVIDKLFSQLSKFSFSKTDRELEMHLAVNDFKMQLSQQPIQFTIGGFYVLTRTFVASVSEKISILMHSRSFSFILAGNRNSNLHHDSSSVLQTRVNSLNTQQ